MKKLYFLAPALICIDLVSKYIAQIYLKAKISIIGDLLYFEFVKNTGVAFSFPISGILLKLVTIILIFGIIAYYIHEEKKKNSLVVDMSFILIISGALGNAYERVFLGEVIDFIGVKYFAIFNLADCFISIGAIIYIYHLYTYKNNIGVKHPLDLMK